MENHCTRIAHNQWERGGGVHTSSTLNSRGCAPHKNEHCPLGHTQNSTWTFCSAVYSEYTAIGAEHRVLNVRIDQLTAQRAMMPCYLLNLMIRLKLLRRNWRLLWSCRFTVPGLSSSHNRTSLQMHYNVHKVYTPACILQMHYNVKCIHQLASYRCIIT